MKNIVGQIPRGEDFFPREEIVNKIYRRLDAGANVYLAAPRRMGKTAIMCHLEDNPRQNYEFKYIITGSVNNPITYFQQLSGALHHLKSLSKKSLEAIKNFLLEFESVSLPTAGVDVKFTKRNKVFEEFNRLIKSLDTQNKTVVIMVDEFPQTVENIARQDGQAAAEQFLQFNRDIRHQANQNIRFLLTGSIGLHTIAEKLAATREINDLNVIEIPPLSREDAQTLIVQLLKSENIAYHDDAIEHFLDKLEWFVPFHIQLAVQELIDAYFGSEQKVNKTAVDKAFAHIIDMRNNHYFGHYYSRLEKTFDSQEYPFALAILKALTQQNELTIFQIKTLAETQTLANYRRVLMTLEFDGYIFHIQTDDDRIYRFTSPVLRQWWREYVF